MSDHAHCNNNNEAWKNYEILNYMYTCIHTCQVDELSVIRGLLIVNDE